MDSISATVMVNTNGLTSLPLHAFGPNEHFPLKLSDSVAEHETNEVIAGGEPPLNTNALTSEPESDLAVFLPESAWRLGQEYQPQDKFGSYGFNMDSRQLNRPSRTNDSVAH